MERRMLLAVVLSFVTITAYSMIMGRGCTAPRQTGDEEIPATEEGANPAGVSPAGANPAGAGPSGDEPAAANGEDPAPGAADADTPAPAPIDEDHPHADIDAETFQLESDQHVVTFTTAGGAISAIRLKHHFELDYKTPLELVVPADPLLSLGAIDDLHIDPVSSEAPGGPDRKDKPAGAMRRLAWKRDKAAESASNAPDVIFTMTHKGRVWTKRWILPPKDRYDIRLQLSVKGTAEDAGKPLRIKVLTAAGLISEPRRGMDMFGTPKVIFHTSPGEDVDDTAYGFGLPKQELSTGLDGARLNLFGTRSLYFTVSYFRPEENIPAISHLWATGEDASKHSAMELALAKHYRGLGREVKGEAGDEGLRTRLVAATNNMLQGWMGLELQPDGTVAELPLYVGPVEREVVEQEAYGTLDNIIIYPMAPDLVAKALLGIYDIFRNLFGSVGLAVILMTLLVRGLMMPLSIRNQLSMRGYSRKIQRIKPKITLLQEKYPKNPKKLREEQMKLYRENGIGFPGGCLMMLLQIPIWFSLFSALRREFTLRAEPFLWIPDLSGPDALFDLGFCIPLIITQICSLNLLPFLMVTLSIIHMRNMPKPQDEQSAQQYKMMKWMPIIFAVVLYNYTAALLIYMTISSGFSILESKIVRAKDAAAEAAGA